MNFKYDTSLGVAKATFLALGSLVFCAPAYAALHQYDVLVDSDNNASTGCAVTAPSARPSPRSFVSVPFRSPPTPQATRCFRSLCFRSLLADLLPTMHRPRRYLPHPAARSLCWR